VVSDFKTAASPTDNMYSHIQQIFMYAYLFYLKFGVLLKYGSILEIPKTGSATVRHIHPITDRDICDMFEAIKNSVEIYLSGKFVKNHKECMGNFGIKCMYFFMCNPATSKASSENIQEKFIIKEN